METTQRGLFAVFLGEPIDLVKAQPHQLFISTASVALMGSFASSSGILDPAIGYLLAIGIEWAYFRGLASDSKAPTIWGAILNWSACIVVVLWGMLWVAELTHTITATASWWLAAAHVIPIAWLSLCSAQTHRAAMVVAVARPSHDTLLHPLRHRPPRRRARARAAPARLARAVARRVHGRVARWPSCGRCGSARRTRQSGRAGVRCRL